MSKTNNLLFIGIFALVFDFEVIQLALALEVNWELSQESLRII